MHCLCICWRSPAKAGSWYEIPQGPRPGEPPRSAELARSWPGARNAPAGDKSSHLPGPAWRPSSAARPRGRRRGSPGRRRAPPCRGRARRAARLPRTHLGRPGAKKKGPHCGPQIRPAETIYKAGGAPKADPFFKRKHGRFCVLVNANSGFVFGGRCVWPGHCRVALEQLLAQPGAAGPEAAASQHGRDGDSIGSNGAARDDMFCGSALADDAAIYSSTSDTRAVAHDVLPDGLCV